MSKEVSVDEMLALEAKRRAAPQMHEAILTAMCAMEKALERAHERGDEKLIRMIEDAEFECDSALKAASDAP